MRILEIIFGIGGLEEALKFNRSSPTGFVSSRNRSKRSAFLSQNDPRDLTNHNLHLARSGGVGYAMDRSKDLQNVFNNSKFRGGGEAIIHAIKNGATTLDAFDGFLPKLYTKYGFIVTGRVPFDDEYAPEGWDIQKSGRPDVVFMAYRGGPRETIEQRVGRFPSYREGEGTYFASYDEAKRAQRNVVARTERRG